MKTIKHENWLVLSCFAGKSILKLFFQNLVSTRKKHNTNYFLGGDLACMLSSKKRIIVIRKRNFQFFLSPKCYHGWSTKRVRCNSAFTLHRVSYITFIQVPIGELHDTAVIPQTLPIIETLHSTLSWTTWSVKAPRRLIPRSPTRKSEEPFYPRKRPQKKFWFCRKTKKILKKFFAAPGILNTTTVWFIVWFMSMYARVIINRPTCK